MPLAVTIFIGLGVLLLSFIADKMSDINETQKRIADVQEESKKALERIADALESISDRG